MRPCSIAICLVFAAGLVGCGDSQSTIEPPGGFNRESVSYKQPDNPGAIVVSLPQVTIKEAPDPPIIAEQVTTMKKGVPMAFEGVVDYFDPDQNELAFHVQINGAGKTRNATAGEAIKSAFRKDGEFHYRLQLDAPTDVGEHSFTLKLLHPPKEGDTELKVSELITGKINVVDSK